MLPWQELRAAYVRGAALAQVTGSFAGALAATPLCLAWLRALSLSVPPCRWLAPEVLQGSPHSFASDTYSFGLVLWELLTWRPPFEGTSNPWQVGCGLERASGAAPPL